MDGNDCNSSSGRTAKASASYRGGCGDTTDSDGKMIWITLLGKIRLT